MTRARVVHHAGVAWAAAVAGAWLVAASCRTIRDAPLPALGPEAVWLQEDAHDRPIRVGIRVAAEQSSIAAPGGVSVRGIAAGENVALVRFVPRATFRASVHAGRIRLLETGDELERAVVQLAFASGELSVDAVRNKARFMSVFVILAMLFSFANISPVAAQEPTCTTKGTPSISTDQSDYIPSSPVVISGGGFGCGVSLTVIVTWPNHVAYTVMEQAQSVRTP